MDPRSEVVLRQIDQLSGQVLFIHAPNDQLLNQLGPRIDASIWTWNFSDYQGFQAAGFKTHFGVDFPQQQFNQVVIFVPKSKELLNYVLHNVVGHLEIGQSVFLERKKEVLNVQPSSYILLGIRSSSTVHVIASSGN